MGCWDVRTCEVVRLGTWKAFPPFGFALVGVSGKIEDGRRKQGVCGLDRFEMGIFFGGRLWLCGRCLGSFWVRGLVLM